MGNLVAVALAGLLAQLVDGSLGMGFGVISTSLLVALAFSPAVASGAVHLAEIGTTIASGSFHLKYGNVDTAVLLTIGIPGAVGAFIGAVVLSGIALDSARPVTSTMLLVMGAVLLVRFARVREFRAPRRSQKRWLVPLGFVGGVVDATGGGGWGPIVTTSLTASNALEPRRAIGTANTAEVLISLSASAGFLLGLGADSIPWLEVAALLAGGLLAAPLAAKFVSLAPERLLGMLAGTLIVVLNVRQLVLSFDAPAAVTIVVFAVTVAAVLVALGYGTRELRRERSAIRREVAAQR